MDDGRAEWHLANWCDWNQRSASLVRGYPSRASGGIGNSGSRSFESYCAETDTRCARVVEALFEDLTQPQKDAVLAVYFGKVFDVARYGDTVVQHFDDALAKIRAGLEKRGII